MTNFEISQLLREVAAAYAVKNEQKYRFQIIAYNKAADSIENTTIEISDAKKFIDEQQPLIIDVRPPNVYAQAHIPNAKNIP